MSKKNVPRTLPFGAGIWFSPALPRSAPGACARFERADTGRDRKRGGIV